MYTRRILLCGLLAFSAFSSVGCCGRWRCCIAHWRETHGCCSPSFDAPCAGPACGPACASPIYAGPGPVYGGPAPAPAPAPGCATCFSGGPVPVAGPAPVPVFGAPLASPTPMAPPSVFQSAEPPMGMSGKK